MNSEPKEEMMKHDMTEKSLMSHNVARQMTYPAFFGEGAHPRLWIQLGASSNAPPISETQAMPNPKSIMLYSSSGSRTTGGSSARSSSSSSSSSSSGSRGSIVLPMITKGLQSINLVENSSGMCGVMFSA